jgi:hypothetical protein
MVPLPRLPSCIALATLLVSAIPVRADEATDFFEKRIRPVLVHHCYECHSTKSRIVQANLYVDSREGLRAGGDSGPAVVPKKPDESLLLTALRYDGLEMPPKGKLPDAIVADFAKWIELGAPDPREKPKVAAAEKKYNTLESGRSFWAFQTPKRHAVPNVKQADWPRSDIDRFLLARLEATGLKPAPDADPATLLRRLHFDLVGLPPTPSELERWLADPSPEHYRKIVDALLSSRAFGERWGRHWLDVARYAESSGGGRSLVFPDAWRYRDYVIESLNADKPYDRFLIEQIAGDLLPFDTPQQRHEQLVATAFLAIGPTNYEEQDKDVLEMDVIDEQIDTIGRTILGMTIGCARCHDHKFDPIPTRDYYALAGIMKSTKTLIHDNVSKWVDAPLPMEPKLAEAVERHAAEVNALQKRVAAARTELQKQQSKEVVGLGKGILHSKQLPGMVLDDLFAAEVGPWKKSTFSGNYIDEGYLYDDRSQGGEKTLTFTPVFSREGRYEVRLAYIPHDNRAEKVPVTILHCDGEKTVHVNMREAPPIDGRFVSLGTYRFDRNGQWFVLVSNTGTNGHISVDAVQFLSEKDLDAGPAIAEIPPGKAGNAVTAQGVKALESELKKLTDSGPKRPVAMSIEEGPKQEDIRICIRGSLTNRGDVAPRGFLRITLPDPQQALTTTDSEIGPNESGRLQLARWVASRDNPLTARVMVNRIWHHLFGTGIVRTPDLFGTTGELPSHPELLDWLALEFQKDSEDGSQETGEGQAAHHGDWSIKRMIRTIVLSRAYQLSSEAPFPENPAVPSPSTLDPRPSPPDPENRLLQHQNRRRLEAECLRDAMLVAGGRLKDSNGGQTLKIGPEGEYGYKFDDTLRSVYTPVLRNRLHELFEVFDFADPNLVLGRRNISTVPTQALFLLNSPFVMQEAEHAAKHALADASLDDAARLDRAYRATLTRLPNNDERRAAMAFLASSEKDEHARVATWSRLYQALFASVDFRYAK